MTTSYPDPQKKQQHHSSGDQASNDSQFKQNVSFDDNCLGNSIPFNRPCVTGLETGYIQKAIDSASLSGDGKYSRKVQNWFLQQLGCAQALLTPSCTHALEMAAILINTQPGDEVIMPSYTFVSTANAFVLRGARIRFVDIRPDTLNIDETKIEQAITDKTIAIVPVHYAGVACEMDTIMQLATRYGLYVIEDAAQAITSKYNGRPLGSIGHLGTFSFHETKNVTSGGEGGLLSVNDESMVELSEVIRDKGTDRSRFLAGTIDKYRWIDQGSSYLMNDISAAYLWGQLSQLELIQKQRMALWSLYQRELADIPGVELSQTGLSIINQEHAVQVMEEPPNASLNTIHNAHIVYIKLCNKDIRENLIQYLSENNIMSVFHYVPLHSSPAGVRFGEFIGEDIYTTRDSSRLLRLPLYHGLSSSDVVRITNTIRRFFE